MNFIYRRTRYFPNWIEQTQANREHNAYESKNWLLSASRFHSEAKAWTNSI